LIIGHAGKCMAWKMLDQVLELTDRLRKQYSQLPAQLRALYGSTTC